MSKQKLIRVLIVTLSSIVLILASFFSAKKANGEKEQITYLVNRVVDGDTIKISINNLTVSVRLLGVDTPETVHPGKPVEHYGPEASTWTKNLLRGERVILEFDDGRSTATIGKYGRILAYVSRAPDGFRVNEELIRQGYARVYRGATCSRQDVYLRLEERAKRLKKGLWEE